MTNEIVKTWIDALCKLHEVHDLTELDIEVLNQEIDEAEGTIDNCRLQSDYLGIACNEEYIEYLEEAKEEILNEEIEEKYMQNNKLICPVKRLEDNTNNKSNIGLNIDFKDDDLNVKVDVSIKSVIKSITDFINKKFKN